MDRLAVTASGVCGIMEADGFTFDEIKAHLKSEIDGGHMVADERFYIGRIPTKKVA